MKKNNSVILKGVKEGIIILLDENSSFEEIKAALTDKISDAREFFKDGKTALTFKGRNLTETEELELLGIVTNVSDLSIVFSHNKTGGLTAELGTDSFQNPTEDSDFKPFNYLENTTCYQVNGLRSGQSVRFPGSVVVLGDVNAGAEIIAEGNVIVMGALKGMAHAGCSGCADCFVAAMRLTPTQLRICDKITYLPEEYIRNSRLVRRPLYAFLRNGQIHIAPLN